MESYSMIYHMSSHKLCPRNMNKSHSGKIVCLGGNPGSMQLYRSPLEYPVLDLQLYKDPCTGVCTKTPSEFRSKSDFSGTELRPTPNFESMSIN